MFSVIAPCWRGITVLFLSGYWSEVISDREKDNPSEKKNQWKNKRNFYFFSVEKFMFYTEKTSFSV